MRKMLQYTTTALTLLLISAGTGCSSTKTSSDRAEIASRRLADTRRELVAARQEVVSTVAALDALVNNPQTDLRPQFQRFSRSVDSLERRGQRARDRATDMRAKREAYIVQWKADAELLSDPKLRERAYARMGEARTSFQNLSDKLGLIREAATPFMAHLRDLERFLGADLTRGGIQSVSDLIVTTREEEKALLAAIDDATAALDQMSIDLSAVAR